MYFQIPMSQYGMFLLVPWKASGLVAKLQVLSRSPDKAVLSKAGTWTVNWINETCK